MAKYRIIAESGAYMARSSDLVRLELGENGSAGARAYNVRAPLCELLVMGTEIELADDFVPGPHLEALDEPAHKAMAAYVKAHPNASLDPTRSLPLGRDPMAARTIEGMVMGQLEAMMAEAVSKPPSITSDAKLDALLAAVTALVNHVATPPVQVALAAPAPSKRA